MSEGFSESYCSNCESNCCNENMVGQVTLEEIEVFAEENDIYFVDSDEYLDVQRKLLSGVQLPRGFYVCPFEYDGEQLYEVIMTGGCKYVQKDGSCGIYKRRPRMCEEFEAGGKECQDIKRGPVIIDINSIK